MCSLCRKSRRLGPFNTRRHSQPRCRAEAILSLRRFVSTLAVRLTSPPATPPDIPQRRTLTSPTIPTPAMEGTSMLLFQLSPLTDRPLSTARTSAALPTVAMARTMAMHWPWIPREMPTLRARPVVVISPPPRALISLHTRTAIPLALWPSSTPRPRDMHRCSTRPYWVEQVPMSREWPLMVPGMLTSRCILAPAMAR